MKGTFFELFILAVKAEKKACKENTILPEFY